MAGAMNRAQRRREKAGQPKRKAAGLVRVRNDVIIVPMEHMETYYAHEIASEGKWADERVPFILHPAEDMGLPADGEWFARTLEQMRETRRRKGTIPVRIDRADGGNPDMDIGLVDITVYFETPPGMPKTPTTPEESETMMTENLRHFDSVCAGAMHDQMLIATVLHRFRSDGSTLMHFHNLIFGLRQEIRGDLWGLGPLDMNPLIEALKKSGRLALIDGKKPGPSPATSASIH